MIDMSVKSSTIIAAFAVVLAVVLIGAAAGCADAATDGQEAGDDTPIETSGYVLTYHIGASSYEVKQAGAAFTVEAVADIDGATIDAGKQFAGWYTEADGKGTAYAVGSTYTIEGAGVTTGHLYAKLIDVATVQYNVGGVIYTQTQTVTGGQIVLPSLTDIGASVPAGTQFKGWYVDGGDKNGVRDDTESLYAAGSTVTLDEGKVYRADTEAVTYEVTFKDGETVVSTVSGTIADTISVPAGPVKDGLTFKGWSTDGETVIDLTGAKFTADATYVAVYVTDYALSFEVSGTVYDGGTVSDPKIPADPSKEGYTFKGWSTDGETVLADLAAAIAGTTSETRFVAVFEPTDCIVTFVADGKTVLTQTVKFGAYATEPAMVPVKEGYDFVGWDFDFALAITEDVTVEALFSETPEPEPTGLKDPVTLTVVAVLVIIIGALLVVGYINREKLKAKMAERLTRGKDDRPKEGNGSA